MNAATTTPLLFNWGAPRRRNLAITGFLIASFAAHVACFYLFQIVYPPTVSLMPAPQRVNLISANSEEGATLLRWVDAEDPALASITRRPSDAKRYLLGKIQHVPSYFAREAQLQAAPPLVVDLRIPSAQPGGAIHAASRPSAPSVGTDPTRVAFSHDLASLGEPNFAPTTFKASGHEPPQNAQFQIAVDSFGVVRYCFPLNSSGDSALDQQARQHLVLCRFAANALPSKVEGPRSTSNAEALVWGIATIEWGNDIAGPNSKSNSKSP